MLDQVILAHGENPLGLLVPQGEDGLPHLLLHQRVFIIGSIQ